MVSTKQRHANTHFDARADGQRGAHSAAKTIVRLTAYVHSLREGYPRGSALLDPRPAEDRRLETVHALSAVLVQIRDENLPRNLKTCTKSPADLAQNQKCVDPTFGSYMQGQQEPVGYIFTRFKNVHVMHDNYMICCGRIGTHNPALLQGAEEAKGSSIGGDPNLERHRGRKERICQQRDGGDRRASKTTWNSLASLGTARPRCICSG